MFSTIVLLLLSVVFRKAFPQKMESFIVDGENAIIEKYPHSAFLEVYSSPSLSPWICGGSVVNQRFILTAAHCVAELKKYARISVVVGNENKNRGLRTSGIKFKCHENFHPETLESDIALIKVKSALPLGKAVKRIILMPKPPISANVYVAGWGLLNEETSTFTSVLKHTRQKLWTRSDCSKVLGQLHRGSICAGGQKGQGYAASGDSGSALVIEGNIQIGIVSYKQPNRMASLVVYTDVSYFYNWISSQMTRLYCA